MLAFARVEFTDLELFDGDEVLATGVVWLELSVVSSPLAAVELVIFYEDDVF